MVIGRGAYVRREICVSKSIELSGTTATAYSIYALTVYEQDVELIQKDRKIVLRS